MPGGANRNRKLLPDGSPNPRYRKHYGGAIRDRKYLPDGSPNPKYRKRSGGQGRSRKLLADGSPNPSYRRSKPRPYVPKNQSAEFIALDGEGTGSTASYQPYKLQVPAFRGFAGTFDCSGQWAQVDPKDKDKGWVYEDQVEVIDQKYGLLAASTGDHVYNPDGLSTDECLALIIKVAKAHPNAIYVGFGLGYDIEMILKDLSRRALRALHRGETVQYNGYELRYIRRKLLWVRDNSARRTHTRKPVSAKLYDVFSFFNASFVATVEEWLGQGYPDLPLLREGKATRAHFTGDDKAFFMAYNDAENRALVLIMEKQRIATHEAGMDPRSWHGPGAMASDLMRQNDTKAHMARTHRTVTQPDGSTKVEEREAVPAYVRDAALHAFAGGRAEVIKVGYTEQQTYKADLNSAYPRAMLELPSVAGGTWARELGGSLADIEDYALYHIDWAFAQGMPFYPFFWRRKGGNIFYPRTGKNWVWGVELRAAVETGIATPRNVRVLESITFRPITDEKPFAWVSEKADERLRRKALPHSDPQHRSHYPLKLGLNSLYGKLAQQRGFAANSDGSVKRIPAFYQPEWSGYVTAHCRASVLRAAMQAPESVLSFQTDAVMTTTKLDLDEGKGLGQWEVEELETFLQCQAGVYFYTVNGELKQHFRGFDPPREDCTKPLTQERVRAAYAHGDPVLMCEMRRFTSLGQALMHKGDEAAFNAYRAKWRKAPRKLDLALQNGKREMLGPKELKRAANELVATKPRDMHSYQVYEGQCMSAPSKVLWQAWESTLADLADLDEVYDGTTEAAVLRDLA